MAIDIYVFQSFLEMLKMDGSLQSGCFKTMEELKPARVTPPSKIFINELKYRGWSLEEFSTRSGISMERLCCPFSIDKEFAEGCSKAFGTSSQMWLNLQARWDRWCLERNLYNKKPGNL